jgi:hypothetical protein
MDARTDMPRLGVRTPMLGGVGGRQHFAVAFAVLWPCGEGGNPEAPVGFGRCGASAVFNEGEVGDVTVAQQASGCAPAAIAAISRLIQ